MMGIHLATLEKKNHRTGSIEVICGSMFSGKTEELIRRLRRAQIAQQRVEIFKPRVDTRYDEDKVVSHNLNAIHSTTIESPSAILELCSDVEVVGIDEAQFFDESLPRVCNVLANIGVRVIVAGLDMDFKGKPFGSMPMLMAIADHVTKIQAICMQCGAPAIYSYRKSEEQSVVLLGEKDNYEPRCRACYVPYTEPEETKE